MVVASAGHGAVNGAECVGGGRGGIRPGLAPTSELQESMRAYWQSRADKGWLYAGEVLAMTERMAKELDAAIDAGDTRA